MAAIVRRHWALVLAIPILILGCILLIFQQASNSRPVQAQEATATEAVAANPEPVAQVDANVYRRAQQLRVELALNNQDMASLGLSSVSAKEILTAVKGFATSNAGPLAQADGTVVRAKRNLQEANRKVNVGPRNEVVLASVPTFKQGVAEAQAQRDVVIASLIGQVNMLLTPDQQTMWSAARSNAMTAALIGLEAPGPYRYVAGLTDVQLRKLDKAARQGGRPALAAVGPQIVNGLQSVQAQGIEQNQRVYAAAVTSAEAQVLPMPESIRSVTIRQPSPPTER